MHTIIVKNGTREDAFPTSASTIGELFRDSEFVEDFSVPGGAVPTIDGEVADGRTAIATGSIVSWNRPVADKG